MSIPDLVKKDPWLEPFRPIIEKRILKWEKKEKELLKISGSSSLSEFAEGYKYYGLRKDGSKWVFREWAPNASGIWIIGSFNDWQKNDEYKLESSGGGIWQIELDEGKLNYGDLYKLLIEWPGGQGERIPAWIKRVVQDENTKIFSGEVIEIEKDFDWTDQDFKLQHDNPVIYEAHVGMSSEEEKVSTFKEFRENILPKIAKGGYNTIQLMAIQEHPYYGSFGYHVSNFFAASSRFGKTQELKALINEAHSMGIAVIMDIVHSHSVKNEIEGLGRFDGTPYQYFHGNYRREHPAWDSLCFDYAKYEVLHFLLSNCKYWLKEFHFDGFRFDGVTSMIYLSHGLGQDFTNYNDYYNGQQDEDGIMYLTLANKLIHEVKPGAITVAEEMSGMPGMATPIEQGGIGFDFRLAMGIPDNWIKLLKESSDENWNVSGLYHELTARRSDEKTISYAESHDQALVGDKTIAFWLMDKEMYYHMHVNDNNLVIDRGMSLHKMIRLVTLATSGGGYLNFMGNEFGHPEWIDFPREGNNWSFKHARRQWSLANREDLKYKYLHAFDNAMIKLINEYQCLKQEWPYVIAKNEGDQVLCFERGGLIFVFNFNPNQSFTDYGLKTGTGKFRILLNSDSPQFGGHGRIDESITYYSYPIASGSSDFYMRIYIPARTALVFQRDRYKSVHDL